MFKKLFERFGWDKCDLDPEIYRDQKGYYQICKICKKKKYLDAVTLNQMKDKSLDELFVNARELQIQNLTGNNKMDNVCPNCKGTNLVKHEPTISMEDMFLMDCKDCGESCYKYIDK